MNTVTFPQRFLEQARRTPNAVAARSAAGVLTYGRLEALANQLACLLRQLGVGPEATVGLHLERGLGTPVAVLGVLRAGGAYVPVDPGEPAARRDGILRDAGVVALITDRPMADPPGQLPLLRLDPEFALLKGLPGGEPNFAGPLPEQAAYLLYTSGSTGRPKGVVVEHRQLSAYADAIIGRLDMAEGKPLSWLMLQPLAVDSSVTALVPPLVTGGEVQLVDRETALDADALADWCEVHRPDGLKIAPSHLRALQASPRFAEVLPRRLLVIGGEASDWRWLRGLAEIAAPTRVFNHYGPTETTVGVTVLDVAEFAHSSWTTAPIGTPLPGTRVLLLDPEGTGVPDGSEGELVIAGPQVARGYHRNPEQTESAFLPDPQNLPGGRIYRTGDFGRQLPDGNFEFLGRRDDQIKIRGLRVTLGEIDAALLAHPGVHQAATMVRADATGRPLLVGYLVPKSQQEFAPGEVEKWLQERLPAHMCPQVLVPLRDLPRSAHGKLDRSQLPLPPSPAADVSAERRLRGELELLIAQEWRELLGLGELDAEQRFFDVGGHSLLLVELQHRLQSALDCRLELSDLLEHSTVRAQAALIAAHGAEEAAEPIVGTNAQDEAERPAPGRQRRAERMRSRRLRTNRGSDD